MKTVLITGAGSGLGKELSVAYAKKGHFIILTGRRLQPLMNVQKSIEQQGGKAVAISLDITNPKLVIEKIKDITKEYSVHFLINNAGIGCFGPLHELTMEEIENTLLTNVNGTIYMTKALLPHLLQQKNGKIFNIISTAGQKGKVNESVYVASKFAIRGFTESLQKEYEGKLDITAVYMGGMDTPFWEDTNHIKDKSRLRSPKEVAEMILDEDEEGKNEIFI